MLVLVDTLRADHLGLYGYSRDTSPALDAWSEGATVFTRARSPSPWTLPSGRALLGATAIEAFDPGRTVAVELQAAGWRTTSLVANHNLSGPFGFDAGWDTAELHDGAPAEEMVGRGLEALRRGEGEGRPHFLFLHFMDPHLPYEEGPAHRELWAGPAPSERLAQGFTEPELRAEADLGRAPLSEAEREHIVARYDQNIRAVDDALGLLLAELGPRDLLLVTADHGEELGERGVVGHGHHLWEEQVHVPLVVGGPGWSAGRSELPVGLDDVGATVLAAAGLPLGGERTGRDLAGLLEAPEARAQRLSHTHYGPARIGLVDGDLKWVGDSREVARIDLGEDPGEATPSVGPWSEAEAEAWAAAGGGPLRPVWHLALEESGPLGVARAPTDVRAVRVQHPGGVAELWWPPAPLRAHELAVRPVDDGLELAADGPFDLPGELWLRLADGPTPEAGATPAGVALTLLRGGEEVDGLALDGVSLAPGLAPPPVVEIPLAMPPPEGVEALQALGYLDGPPEGRPPEGTPPASGPPAEPGPPPPETERPDAAEDDRPRRRPGGRR